MAPLDASDASWTSPGAGISGGYNGDSEALRIFIVFFLGLSIYNACELITMVFLSFKRFHGLYFWATLIAGAGIIPYSIGFLLKFMNLTPDDMPWVDISLITVGWYPMITGQAVVLWSRLHLIVYGKRGDKILKWTRNMIVINAFILHIPTTVLTFGSNGMLQTQRFVTGYNIMEKIQMIGFFTQEVILSSIYISETMKILRTSLQVNTRKTMQQLLAINIAIIIMDLILLALECASLYIVQSLIKGVIYSIKLKLEFAILGKLVTFVRNANQRQHMRSLGFITADRSKDNKEVALEEIVDLMKVKTEDVTHAEQSRRKNGTPLEIGIARFEHVEDVDTLTSTHSTSTRSIQRHVEKDEIQVA